VVVERLLRVIARIWYGRFPPYVFGAVLAPHDEMAASELSLAGPDIAG